MQFSLNVSIFKIMSPSIFILDIINMEISFVKFMITSFSP